MEQVSPPARKLLLISQRPIDGAGANGVRWRSLKQHLPERGWSVDVVSGEEPAGADAEAHRRSPGKQRAADLLRRVGTSAGVSPIAFLPGPGWAVSGRAEVRRALEQGPDVALATSPPINGLIAAASVLRGSPVPFVAEFRDLWAGNAENDGGRAGLARLQRRFLRDAARVVVVTEDARRRLAELHPELAGRLVVVPNGFDPSLLERRVSPPPRADGRTLLVHAGQLYGSRSIGGLLGALATPALRDRVRFRNIGTLNERSADAIEQCGGDLALDIVPPTTWEEATAQVAAADIAVVVFTPGDDTAVPGKLYEALALGRPVLALVERDSAMRRLLADLGQDAGVALHDDPAAIAAAVGRLLDDPPPSLDADALAPFDRTRIAARMAGLLDEVADEALARTNGAAGPRA